jgi:hypothetical protein
MPARPFLDASNIHAVVTTRWESGSYQPFTIDSVESYTLETNLDEDSDPFGIVIGDRFGEFAEMLQRDNEIRIQVFGIGEGINYLMTGIVDSAVYSDQGVFVLNGRDLSSIATDTIAEPITYRHVRASDVIEKRARALKCAPRIQLTPTNVLGKVTTDGSETEWEFWYRYIRRAGQWLWYEPDGTLKSGKLNYEADPTYYLGEPPKGDSSTQWIPVETGEFHSSKQGRVGKVILYYHNAKRILPITLEDPTTSAWLRRPTKLFEQKDIHRPKTGTAFLNEEIYETKVGAQEIKLVVPDPGILVRQNSMARLNVPDLQLGGDWFIVGSRIIADEGGFTQEIRLREKGFAISRRVPSDPPQSQEPGQKTTEALAGQLQIPHPEWAQFFINAAREFHGGFEFEWFLAVLLAICDQETGFFNERAFTGGWNDAFISAPGVTHIEWFDWDESVAGPQHGVKNLAEWRLSFANQPGPYVDFNFAVGPMQLYDISLKEEADKFGNAQAPVSELMGNRWSPEANIWIAAKSLHERAVASHTDGPENEKIFTAIASYGGSTAYANSVMARAKSTWYPMVQAAFEAAQSEENQNSAVEAVQGTVQDIAKSILDYHKQGKYRDDNGQELPQIEAMANGQRIDTPSCPQLGKIQISAKTLGAIKLCLDSGYLIGTFALASDHTHLGCGSRHSSGNAVDISSVGVPGVGFIAVASGGKACQRITMDIMNLFRAQKRGVLKPNQMICNGVGGVFMKTVQSLQLDNYEDSNYVDGDHTDHIHVGY